MFELPDHMESVPCPLCGGNDAEPFRETRDLLFASPGIFTFVRCRSCDLVYLRPRPTLAALGEYYPSDYFCYRQVTEGNRSKQQATGGNAALVMRLRIRHLERHTRCVQPTDYVLDVGCGANVFNYHLERQRSCRTLGLDFNTHVVERARRCLNMQVRAGTLIESELPAGEFNFVTMHEYLEHEPQPRAALEQVRRILKPDGFLAIEVPNVSSGIGKLFRSNWVQLDAPRHLVMYSPRTLRIMLDRSGFEMLAIRPHTSQWIVGFSMMAALGHRRMGRATLPQVLLGVGLSLPLLPLPWIFPEFMRAYARPRR